MYQLTSNKDLTGIKHQVLKHLEHVTYYFFATCALQHETLKRQKEF